MKMNWVLLVDGRIASTGLNMNIYGMQTVGGVIICVRPSGSRQAFDGMSSFLMPNSTIENGELKEIETDDDLREQVAELRAAVERLEKEINPICNISEWCGIPVADLMCPHCLGDHLGISQARPDQPFLQDVWYCKSTDCPSLNKKITPVAKKEPKHGMD